MALPVLISDRLTASGFRLAGVRPLLTEPEDAAAVFRETLASKTPLMITAALAQHVPEAQLLRAVIAADPPVAVIPDIVRRVEPPDMAVLVRRALGVET